MMSKISWFWIQKKSTNIWCFFAIGLAPSSCCQGIWNRRGGAWHVRDCGVVLVVVLWFQLYIIPKHFQVLNVYMHCVMLEFLLLIWFCCYHLTFSLSLWEAYNALLKGLVLQRNFKSAEDWLKTMQKVQLAPKLGSNFRSFMLFQLMRYNVRGESLQGTFLDVFGFRRSI